MWEKTEERIHIIVTLEMVSGSIGLVSVMLIFITFGLFKRLRTLPNTFIFFASIANVGGCVAVLIGRHGIDNIEKYNDKTLCMTQAFLLQM